MSKTVIEMAREAKLPEAWISETGVLKWSGLERFSEVVRADAIAEEREACVKAADDQWVRNPNVSGGDAIRARGQRSDEASIRSNT